MEKKSSDRSSSIKRPAPPPSRMLLERGFLGVKHFASQEEFESWKSLPWWKRLFS